MTTNGPRGRAVFFGRFAPFVLAAAMVGTSSPAHASPQQDLEAAEQAYANLDYPEANKLAERVVKQRGLTHDQLVRSYRLLALTHAVLDREVAAKDAFILLLTYEPDYAVDTNLGPRVQTPFFEARGFWRAQSSKPGLDTATVLRAREPGLIRVTTRDPTRIVRKVVVGYRWGSDGEIQTKIVPAGESVPVDVAPAPPGTTRLDYFAQALDERDDVVYESGSRESPKSAVVQVEQVRAVPPAPAQEGRSLFSSPVFWVVTGVVVVGAATAVGFLALKPQAQVVDRPLPPTGAALGPVFNCGGTPCN